MNKLKLLGLSFLLQTSVVAAAPVSDRVMVNVGSTAVYLEVSGPSKEAPVVLFLHGGPGSVAHLIMFQSTVGKRLERDFLVAYLHQRGTGKSPPVPDSEQTIANHVNDVDQVVKYLTRTYNRKQVSLVGHSWGGMLAGEYLVAHPEEVRKVVLISTAINFRSLLQDSYEGVLKWAKSEHNLKAVSELTALGRSFDTEQDFGVILGWADKAGGVAKDFDMDAFLKNHHVDQDFPNWRSLQGKVNGALIPEMLRINLTDSIARLQIPALFVSGALDTIVPEATMRRDYANYRGPKSFVLLEQSHHLAFIDEPANLTSALRGFLLN
jgi:proline iminopeptidase